jgi:Protein of unknown function (DUF4230)
MKKLIGWLIFGLIFFGGAFGGAYYYQQKENEKTMGQVVTVASASLAGLKSQARLTPFIARFVAVVTSKQQRYGLTAERTMIMPGVVRYEVDLAVLEQKSLHYNAKTKTLEVTLPPIVLAGPEVDMTGIKEYGQGGILTALTDAEDVLDDANRAQAQAELLRQAKEDAPMQLARDAAKAAVERSFAMPLKAARIQASVEAKFAGESASKAAAPHVSEGH